MNLRIGTEMIGTPLIGTASIGVLLIFAASCTAPVERSESSAHGETPVDAAYVYDDLGPHHREITTSSSEAQRFFDQGLILAFAFNHDEAIRSFTEATRIDPKCAMAWWGIALANGPHINLPMMTPERSKAAWEALEKARALRYAATPIERELIDALAKRYAETPPDDREALDRAYAGAMRTVWRTHPNDADIGTLCAEALMDLHPWDLWTIDGKPKPHTPEIVETLESVLQRAPEHPGANHLYIHAIEASAQPARAKAAADRLRTLVPGSSHLVHMPSHIDIRVGRFDAASESNIRAMEVDRKHADRTGRAGFYRVYMAHNVHFLSFASMMEGRSEVALRSAREMVAGFPPELLEKLGPFVDGMLPIAVHVLVRFGRWDEVLREPELPRAFWGCECGAALWESGRVDGARATG